MLQHMGLAPTSADPIEANRMAVAPALRLLQQALSPGSPAAARVTAQCAAFLRRAPGGGDESPADGPCMGGTPPVGGDESPADGPCMGGTPPVGAPTACNGHGAILTPEDAELLRGLLCVLPSMTHPCMPHLLACFWV